MLTAGAQVPVIGVTLVELVGNTGAVAFWQTFAMALNVGVTGALIVNANDDEPVMAGLLEIILIR